MKLSPVNVIRHPRFAAGGFTLAEMLVAMTIFMVVIFATVAVQLYASRVYTMTASTLGATQEARITMNDIRDKVREARTVYIGNNSSFQAANPLANFIAVTNNSAQQGNALVIYPYNTANAFTFVFLEPSSSSMYAFNANALVGSTNSLILVTYTNSTMLLSNDVADYITNQVIFDAENFQGTVLSNFQNNYLVHLTLDFSQWRYPNGFNALSNVYNYYQINTVITRRDTD
jgi:type II secretory pathway pseudopilin PulG